ncbi:MAG: trypsin-like peptidase domain-containing protein [Candidatus Zixiibacteriota bacterium]
MTTNRISNFIVTVLAIILLMALAVRAEDPSSPAVPFGKTPGSWYYGGTSGLSGIDSVRGYIDSLFYLKAAAAGVTPTVGESPGVIYGDDDRRDIYTLTDPNQLKLAQATCVVIQSYEVSYNGNGTYTLSTSPWTIQGGLPLCAGERFAGQRRIGFCSGFLVAPDIVVTAGHCLSACGGIAFLFGFEQVDSLTPPVPIVSEDNIYFCSEVIDRRYSGDLDHCVVRLDRPVVGRTPIPIRRSGLVDNGEPLVVLGHPTVLPMKAAAGAEVKDNRGTTPWFQANTDTYGGNSGSMVVNTNTWQIEGILVRGAPDFVYTGGCARSNVVPNTGNTGSGLRFEEISKIESVAGFIPLLITSAGEVSLGSAVLSCNDRLAIELRDLDLAGQGSYSMLVVTSAADSEQVVLDETAPLSAVFVDSIVAGSGTVVPHDGVIQVSHGTAVTAVYFDADHGGGTPATVEASVTADCLPPMISAVTVAAVGGTWVTVEFVTDESAAGRVMLGTACGSYTNSVAGTIATSHQISLVSLTPATSYRFIVQATDEAGNMSEDDNGGNCFEFTTTGTPDFFTQQFTSGFPLEGKTLALIPDESASLYHACLIDSPDFLTTPEGHIALGLTDDSFAPVSLGGDQVLLYGTAYSTVYVGSNGFVTFATGNSDWSESLDEHFASPARVSVFWDDLDPAEGGQVTYAKYSNRLVVTWEDVPEHSGTNVVSMQLQMYFGGVITMTYKKVEPLDGIVGLSAGGGISLEFTPSDLSQYPACQVVVCYPDADLDDFGMMGDPGYMQFGAACAEGTSDNAQDCDDADPSRNPDAQDLPDDGIDQDCDGVDASCCVGMVGDANNSGGDAPTIGDVTAMIDYLFLGGAPLACLQEGDINQSGGRYPVFEDLSIGDITTLIDHLFISGAALSSCL